MNESSGNSGELTPAVGSESSDRLGAGLIPMFKWTHPSWDKFLITGMNFMRSDIETNDFLGAEDDPTLLEVESVYMTKAQIEDLGEWDG